MARGWYAACEIDWGIDWRIRKDSRGPGMVYSYWKDWGEIVLLVEGDACIIVNGIAGLGERCEAR